MLIKSTTVNRKQVLVKEVTVAQAMTFVELDMEDLSAISYFMGTLIVEDVEVNDFTKDDIDEFIKTFITIHPDLIKANNANKDSNKTTDPSKLVAKKKAATIRFKQAVLSHIINGHPNLLDYPYSLYVELGNLKT